MRRTGRRGHERPVYRPGTAAPTAAKGKPVRRKQGLRGAFSLEGRRVAVVSMMPVENLDTIAPGDSDRKRADYLVYTIK